MSSVWQFARMKRTRQPALDYATGRGETLIWTGSGHGWLSEIATTASMSDALLPYRPSTRISCWDPRPQTKIFMYENKHVVDNQMRIF